MVRRSPEKRRLLPLELVWIQDQKIEVLVSVSANPSVQAELVTRGHLGLLDWE